LKNIIKNCFKEILLEEFKKKSPLSGKLFFTFGDGSQSGYFDANNNEVHSEELISKLKQCSIFKEYGSFEEWHESILAKLTNLTFSANGIESYGSKERLFNVYKKKGGNFIVKKLD
jgi:hypothetical protein